MNKAKKKLILFDIDYTLFNASDFRDSFFSILVQRIPHSNKEILLNVLQQVYEEAKTNTSFFDPKTYLALLQKRLPSLSEISVLQRAIMNEAMLENSLYKETKEVLRTLAQDKNTTIGIFSWGNIGVQKAKIKSLERYLQTKHIHIVEFDKKNILPKIVYVYADWDLYIIDDFQEVLIEAKRLDRNIYTIWIKRPETEGKRRIFENFTPDSIISSLSEVVTILEEK